MPTHNAGMNDENSSLLPVPAGEGCLSVANQVPPWPLKVVGAQVLAALSTLFNHFLFLARGVADALSLWVAHTYCVDEFSHSPRLAFCSAEPGSGKSAALDILFTLSSRPVIMDCPSEASLCRLIHQVRPTLLLDETDNWLSTSRGLTSLLNSGHRQGPARARCIGSKVRVYLTYGPVALAGLGDLPPTLQTRALVVRMLPPKAGETREPFDILNCNPAKELGRKLARWVMDNRMELRHCRPNLPANAVNRIADNWRPLFAIAEVAGGDWPERARDGFEALKSEASQGLSSGKMLLKCIQAIFAANGAHRIASKVLVSELAKSDDLITNSTRWTRPPTAQDVAQILRPYRIKPSTMRINGELAKGYALADFADAFERYLS